MEIRTVENRKQLKEFIMLPWQLHKSDTHWLPPIISDEWDYFDRNKNPAFTYCDTVIAVAYRGNQAVGRIMGVINKRHNEIQNEKTARFSLFDCINDTAVAHELLSFIEHWAKGKGLTKLIGPFGMNYHDPMGYMVEGFENIPAVSTYTNPRYIIPLLEQHGFSKEQDLVVYKIMINGSIPELYKRILQKVSSNNHIKSVSFKLQKDLKNYIVPVLKLMNKTFTEIFGYSDIDEHEMKILARHYLPVLDPRFVKVIEYDGEVAGFTVAMPNISTGIKAANGRLFPFGFLKILKSQKKSKQLDLLIGGIHKKYRGIGLDVLMGMDMIETARDSGFEFIDSHLELESNVKVRAEMEKQGGVIYKRYRIFQKSLM